MADKKLVRMPDGVVVDFTGMSDDEIRSKISSKFPELGADVMDDMLRSGARGLAEGVEGPLNILPTIEELMRTYMVDPVYSAITGKEPPAGRAASSLPRMDIGGTVEALGGSDFTQYEPKTKYGEAARTVGQFLPTSVTGPQNVLRQIAFGGVIPALGSEAAGQLTEGTAAEPYARLVGSLAAPVAASVGEGAIRSLVSPAGGVGSDGRLAYDALLRSEGVIPTAGQATGSRSLLAREGMTDQGMALAEATGEQFTKAVLKRAGIDATRATPEVLLGRYDELGKQMDDLAKISGITADETLGNDVLDAIYAYKDYTTTPVPAAEKIANKILEIVTRPTNGRDLLGSEFQTIRSELKKFADLTQDPAAMGFIADISKSVSDALGRTLNAAGVTDDIMGAWRQTNRYYANLIPIAKSSERATMDLISPVTLRTHLLNQNNRAYQTGQQDLAPLTRAGTNVLQRMPSSGTAERLGAVSPKGLMSAAGLGSAAGFATGDVSTGIMTAIPTLLAGATPAAYNRFIASPLGQAYARNQLISPAPSTLPRAIPSATAGLINSQMNR